MADGLHTPVFGILETLPRNTTPAFSNHTLNQTTDALEFYFQFATTGAITRVWVRLGVITGTTPTYRVSLQSVSAGAATGTILGGGSPASATFSPSGLGWTDGTGHWITLDNAYTPPTRAPIACLVIDYSSGTCDSSNNASFTAGCTLPQAGVPYVTLNEAGSRSKQPTRLPLFGYGTTTVAYGFPLESITDTTYDNATTPDEYAMSFALPAGWGATYVVDHVHFAGSLQSTSSVYVLNLYTGTTVLATATGAAGYGATTAGTHGAHDYYFQDTTLPTLDHGSTYRVGLNAADTNNVRVLILGQASADDWVAWPGGASAGYSTRTDAGAWTDDATKRLLMSVQLSDITEPAAGGAGGVVIGS